MANRASYVRKNYRMSDLLSTFTQVSLSSVYQVNISPNANIMALAAKRGLNTGFIVETLGLLCSDASLPATSYNAFEIQGDRVGKIERYANQRIYEQTDFTFYVDKDYGVLRFFELWMEFISPAYYTDYNSSYYHFNYPDSYVCDMSINKFEKSNFSKDSPAAYHSMLTYNFKRIWPISVQSIPVSYQGSDVLKCTVSFNYERFDMRATRSENMNASSSPAAIRQRQTEFENNLLEATGGGEFLIGAGTFAELNLINNGGSFGGPFPEYQSPAFQGNFGTDVA